MQTIIVVFIFGLCNQALTLSISSDTNHARRLYEQFKREYGRETSNDDDEMRFQIFRRNLGRAEMHQQEDRGTAKFGITKYSDLTEKEFAAIYLNLRIPKDLPKVDWSVVDQLTSPPDYFDWRMSGAVNDVEDQGACGSCWTFSVVGSIEGHWAVKKSQLLRLSKQQLLDCDKTSYGCDGGYPWHAFTNLIAQGGIMLDDRYPYEARQSYCGAREEQFVAYINGSVGLPRNEEIQKAYMSMNGPLSVCLNAEYLQFYKSGVINPPHWKCTHERINHAVLTVGYGQDKHHPFWVVKNSWGYDWGEQGYFRIQRGTEACGINKLVFAPTIN